MESTGYFIQYPFYIIHDGAGACSGMWHVAIEIRAGEIDEGADGVTNFYPAKIWALGSTWS